MSNPNQTSPAYRLLFHPSATVLSALSNMANAVTAPQISAAYSPTTRNQSVPLTTAPQGSLLKFGDDTAAAQVLLAPGSAARGCLCVDLTGHNPGRYLVLVVWSQVIPADPSQGGCLSCTPKTHISYVIAHDDSDRASVASFGGQPLMNFVMPISTATQVAALRATPSFANYLSLCDHTLIVEVTLP